MSCDLSLPSPYLSHTLSLFHFRLSRYPTFEGRTGWKMEGNYAPLPDAVAAQLREFYRPFNAMLPRMLNQDDFPWAK